MTILEQVVFVAMCMVGSLICGLLLPTDYAGRSRGASMTQSKPVTQASQPDYGLIRELERATSAPMDQVIKISQDQVERDWFISRGEAIPERLLPPACRAHVFSYASTRCARCYRED